MRVYKTILQPRIYVDPGTGVEQCDFNIVLSLDAE
jgi:hypothetical protein